MSNFIKSNSLPKICDRIKTANYGKNKFTQIFWQIEAILKANFFVFIV
jgi:hypothetical protein